MCKLIPEYLIIRKIKKWIVYSIANWMNDFSSMLWKLLKLSEEQNLLEDIVCQILGKHLKKTLNSSENRNALPYQPWPHLWWSVSWQAVFRSCSPPRRVLHPCCKWCKRRWVRAFHPETFLFLYHLLESAPWRRTRMNLKLIYEIKHSFGISLR